MTSAHLHLDSDSSVHGDELTPGVSVIVPTYRRVERLAACLEGLRSQSRHADEVLVVVHTSDVESAALVEGLARDWPELQMVRADRVGLVQAYNYGLAAARGAIVAFVDDDAVPRVDWLERIVATFESDRRIAAVGGRDVIIENGRVAFEPGGHGAGGPIVGRIHLFGRLFGNHHIGLGAPRDVDVLKGVNMSFRRSAIASLGFDERLQGRGAQIHSELSICLPLRRQGLRVVYDPEIEVTHFPSVRAYGDLRDDLALRAVFASAHNEALQILDHFGPIRRVVYAARGVVVGNAGAPGLAVLARDLIEHRPAAWSRFSAAQVGRAAAWKTRRSPRPKLG